MDNKPTHWRRSIQVSDDDGDDDDNAGRMETWAMNDLGEECSLSFGNDAALEFQRMVAEEEAKKASRTGTADKRSIAIATTAPRTTRETSDRVLSLDSDDSLSDLGSPLTIGHSSGAATTSNGPSPLKSWLNKLSPPNRDVRGRHEVVANGALNEVSSSVTISQQEYHDGSLSHVREASIGSGSEDVLGENRERKERWQRTHRDAGSEDDIILFEAESDSIEPKATSRKSNCTRDVEYVMAQLKDSDDEEEDDEEEEGSDGEASSSAELQEKRLDEGMLNPG